MNNERIVLITNLFEVSLDTSFGKARTPTNALILFDRGPDDDTGARYRAQGFRNAAENPTFDLTLPSFDWSIESQSYKRSFALCFAGTTPGTLGPKIWLSTDFANDAPLDIESWELRESDGHTWGDMLLRKVLRYYHAPYIVLGQQHDADQARKALGVVGIAS